MKDVGIRELKARASDLVRRVAEEHATYTITRRGRAVGVLAPPDFLGPVAGGGHDNAWDQLDMLAERLRLGRGSRKSAVGELAKMRR